MTTGARRGNGAPGPISATECQDMFSGGVALRITGPRDAFAQASKFFEAMLMPLGDDEETVTKIFGAFEFDWRKPGI